MILSVYKRVVSTSEINLTRTEAGVLRIGDNRISLDSVIVAFNQRSAPKGSVYDYDSLTLSEVYAAISYYRQNQKFFSYRSLSSAHPVRLIW